MDRAKSLNPQNPCRGPHAFTRRPKPSEANHGSHAVQVHPRHSGAEAEENFGRRRPQGSGLIAEDYAQMDQGMCQRGPRAVVFLKSFVR
eukprot:1389046-Amorphochlora_amoeboformis.AAC.1